MEIKKSLSSPTRLSRSFGGRRHTHFSLPTYRLPKTPVTDTTGDMTCIRQNFSGTEDSPRPIAHPPSNFQRRGNFWTSRIQFLDFSSLTFTYMVISPTSEQTQQI